MPIIHFNHATWLAARAQDAAEIGTPEPPSHFALPGARKAIRHERLLAHQDAGHDTPMIVKRINRQWTTENQHRLDAHRQWVGGSYVPAIEQMRREDAKRRAAELEREARFQAFLDANGEA